MNAVETSVLNMIEEHRSEIIQFVQELVRIPSETGHEKDCQDKIAKRMQAVGLEVDYFMPEDIGGLSEHPKWISGNYSNRPNVVGYYAGSGGGRSLLLMAHIDTVLTGPPELWQHSGPYSGSLVDGKIYGRGTTDDKGELAAMIIALEFINKAGIRLRGDLWLCSVIDEESGGGIGTLACVVRGYRADAAIYCDGLDMKLQIANLGNIRCLVSIQNPIPGASVDRTVRQLNTVYSTILQWRDERAQRFAQNPLYRDTEWPDMSVWIAQFCAGEEAGIDLGHGQLKVYVFVLPGEDIDTVRAEFMSRVEHASRSLGLSGSEFEVLWLGQEIEPSEVNVNEPIVSAVTEAFRTVIGQNPVIGGQPGCDTYLLNNYVTKMPSVSFGYGIWGVPEGAHQIDESVSVDQQLLPYIKILALSILRWCGYEML